MILKISDGCGGWILFDHVDQAYLVPESHNVKSPIELNQIGNKEVLNLVSKECFEKTEYVLVGIIQFEIRGVTRQAFFTNAAYVCNDSGDTLDKLNVHGLKKSR